MMRKIVALLLIMQFSTCLLLAQNIAYSKIYKPKGLFIKPQAGINHVIIYGQSLSTGQQTPPALSIKNYDGNLMLGDQVWSNFSNNLDTANLIFNPLVAKPTLSSHKTNQDILGDTTIDANNQINCEPPVIGFTNAVKFWANKYASNFANKKFAASSCGEGGRSIELLMKNCPNRNGVYYKYYLKTIAKAIEAAARMKQPINCTAILWMQGEYNYTQAVNQGWLPNTPATYNKDEYKHYFSTLVTDMLSDVKLVYKQRKPPVFITYQCGAQFTKDANISIGMAQLELTNQDPRVIMAGPVYPVTDRGGHLCPNGSRWYGEMMAKVYFKTVIKGERWIPLKPRCLTKGTNYIDIAFAVPQKPLHFDTLTLQKVKDYGFEVKENGKIKAITGITLVNDDIVRLQLDAKLVNGDLELSYAGRNTMGNGNLCDSDLFQSFETYKDLIAEGTTLKQQNRFKPKYEPKDEKGQVIYNQHYPLQNFSCAFYYTIPSWKQIVRCY